MATKGNTDTRAAKEYHAVTKHSPASIRTALHRLDWSNRPRPFKGYEDLPSTPLPTEFSPPDMATLQAISSEGEDVELDLRTLAQVLYFSAGITKEARTPDGTTIHFRAAASAGALYPIELYVVCEALDGLPAGVYHFAPRDLGLTQLRAGDFRSHLAELAGEGESGPPATLVLAAIFWRSAWKYRARAYRYCFWDSGTILANLLATATSARLGAPVVAGFDDKRLDRLLGVDGNREVSLCLVPLGPSRELPPGQPPVPPLNPKTLPLSREEVEYPPILAIHHASYLDDPGKIRQWKGSLGRTRDGGEGQASPLSVNKNRGRPLGETILRRGSTRHFRRTPIARDQLGAILHYATRGFEADFLDGDNTRLVDLYLIVNEVTGVPPGAYYYAGDRP
ncbi:MAG: SagB family peptide dehydrogenase, partial [Thermoplasmata archaeon]